MLTLRFYAETDTFPSKSICFGRFISLKPKVSLAETFSFTKGN